MVSVAVAATVKLKGWPTKPTAFVLLTMVGGASGVVAGYRQVAGMICLTWLLLYQDRLAEALPVAW